MDPEEDQTTTVDAIGTIRWAGGETPIVSTSTTITSTPIQQAPETSHQCLRNKVTYYEKVWSSGQKPNASDTDETDRGAFAIDVHAFEKRLQEERDRKSNEQSPRIDVKLRSTPQPSPRPTDSPLSNIQVNIRHHIETDASPSTSDGHQERKRALTYERKVVSMKSVREVNISSRSEHVTSPIVHSVEYTELHGKSPSSERITVADDSAYHSHRTRHVSSSTPTTVTSQSSSNTSLHGNFPSEENVFVRHIHQQPRTPSRERIFIRAGSEPHSWSSDTSSGGGGSTANNIGVAKTTSSTASGGIHYHGASPVSSVAAGNNEFVRRHLVRERHESGGDSDGASSPDWYNEYRTHTLHTTTPPNMDFKRSNSQYDNHIRQIRGICCCSCSCCFYFLIKIVIRRI